MIKTYLLPFFWPPYIDLHIVQGQYYPFRAKITLLCMYTCNEITLILETSVVPPKREALAAYLSPPLILPFCRIAGALIGFLRNRRVLAVVAPSPDYSAGQILTCWHSDALPNHVARIEKRKLRNLIPAQAISGIARIAGETEGSPGHGQAGFALRAARVCRKQEVREI